MKLQGILRFSLVSVRDEFLETSKVVQPYEDSYIISYLMGKTFSMTNRLSWGCCHDISVQLVASGILASKRCH
jgi:hypothetical protein